MDLGHQPAFLDVTHHHCGEGHHILDHLALALPCQGLAALAALAVAYHGLEVLEALVLGEVYLGLVALEVACHSLGVLVLGVACRSRVCHNLACRNSQDFHSQVPCRKLLLV